MRTDPCCHIYATFLCLPLMCCAGFFIYSASMSLAETLISYMGQGEEVCHLKYLDLVNTILNDKKFRISRNHFSVTNENLSHISSSFVGLGLNPTQKPHICLVTSSNVHGLGFY